MSLETRAGYEINHREMGEGAREALLLHCSLAHSGAWKGLGVALADKLHMVAFDHLTHGKSAPWDGTGDYHDASTAVAKTFLSADSPIDLVGHSFGATVALRLALEEPEKVRSLVLIEPVLFSVVREASKQAEADYLRETAYLASALRQGDTHAAAKVFIDAWGAGQGWEGLPEVAQNEMARQIHIVPASQPVIFDDTANLLGKGRLEAVQCPVLMLRGGKSPAVMKVINDAVAARLPNAQNTVVPGAGHMVPITHPMETAELLRAFWRL